jgi:hypothetical protein
MHWRLHAARSPAGAAITHRRVPVACPWHARSYSEATPHSRLLLATLRRLAAPRETLIFLALSLHHNPGEVARFLGWAAEEGFETEDVASELPEEYRVEDVRVVRMRWLGPPAGAADGMRPRRWGRS